MSTEKSGTEAEADLKGEPRSGGEKSLEPEVEWTPNFPLIRKIDRWWHFAERVVCGAMFLFMALLVFVAVVYENFGTRHEWIDVGVLFGFIYLATRTRVLHEGEKRLSHPVSLAIAAVLTGVIATGVYFFGEKYTSGFVFAQKLAMVMMLWVALLGASMATYERTHLALEMGEMVWHRRAVHIVKALAHALTSAFCIALVILSLHMVQSNQDHHVIIQGLEWIPQWVAVLILPYTFAVMAIRILAQSFTVGTRCAEPMEEQIPT